MMGRMTWQGAFLKDVLKETNQNKRQQKLRSGNAAQINAVSELVMNTLREAIRPGRKTVPKLKPYSKQPDCKSSSEYKKKTQTHDSSIRSRCLEWIKTLLSLC